MKRPDSDVIRRLLKSGALNGKVLSAGYNGRHGWSLDKVLGLPYFYLSYKKMEEFDFTTSDDFLDATDGTLLGNPVKVIEKSTMVLMWLGLTRLARSLSMTSLYCQPKPTYS